MNLTSKIEYRCSLFNIPFLNGLFIKANVSDGDFFRNKKSGD